LEKPGALLPCRALQTSADGQHQGTGSVGFAGLSPVSGSCYCKAKGNPNAIFGSSAANAVSALKEGELCI